MRRSRGQRVQRECSFEWTVSVDWRMPSFWQECSSLLNLLMSTMFCTLRWTTKKTKGVDKEKNITVLNSLICCLDYGTCTSYYFPVKLLEKTVEKTLKFLKLKKTTLVIATIPREFNQDHMNIIYSLYAKQTIHNSVSFKGNHDTNHEKKRNSKFSYKMKRFSNIIISSSIPCHTLSARDGEVLLDISQIQSMSPRNSVNPRPHPERALTDDLLLEILKDAQGQTISELRFNDISTLFL